MIWGWSWNSPPFEVIATPARAPWATNLAAPA